MLQPRKRVNTESRIIERRNRSEEMETETEISKHKKHDLNTIKNGEDTS